jgi:hypothetical protein
MDKPKYRLCWWCNLKLSGNHFTTKVIDGHERILHKRCKRLSDDGIEPNWAMLDNPDAYEIQVENG